MAFKKKSYPVHPRDLDEFAKLPASIAILIDASFMTHWPHEWTRDGNRSRRRHEWQNRGYDADGVLNEASWRLRAEGVERCGLIPMQPGQLRPSIGRMRGEIQDREEGDLT